METRLMEVILTETHQLQQQLVEREGEGISRSFYRQVIRGADLFARRCTDCSLPAIHDESQLIDSEAENSRPHTDPHRDVPDISVIVRPVLKSHQNVVDLSVYVSLQVPSIVVRTSEIHPHFGSCLLSMIWSPLWNKSSWLNQNVRTNNGV
ncbi:hypothetical protein LSH36_132g04027 [Paralvinella palmiformis]|uniref:Uncharacterized protein n=1 Tax=Paralvinella palmiformis TaxID=53620 RepID=A0AAD9JWC1_9ANNE|nr:hypothetical protein LSH36_132g04027 [Paralvinella palmiformis]